MTTLVETFARQGRTLEVAAAWVQQFIDEHYMQVWQDQQQGFEALFVRAGEPAYARYSQALFRPIIEELKQAGLDCDPGFPGLFPASREQWGPQEERERRFWSVLHQAQDADLGTLVTSFFHDHTSFRIPRPPTVLTLTQTNQTIIAQLVERSALPGL